VQEPYFGHPLGEPGAHDLAGNMTTIPQPKDATKKLDLKYDAWNRVVEIKNDVGTVITTNEYDGLNRRIVRIEGGETRHFYYNQQWQVIEESTGSGHGAIDAIYSYHPFYVDAVAIRMRSNNEHLYLHDANFNVTAVTDRTGATALAAGEPANSVY